MKGDPLDAPPVEVRVGQLENYLTRSSNESKEIVKFTGVQVKTLNEGHQYRSTIINEVVTVIGSKTAQFSQEFDGPNLWATLEAICHHALVSDPDTSAIVSKMLLAKKVEVLEDAKADLSVMFVKVEEWKDFLLKFSQFVQREQAEKV